MLVFNNHIADVIGFYLINKIFWRDDWLIDVHVLDTYISAHQVSGRSVVKIHV